MLSRKACFISAIVGQALSSAFFLLAISSAHAESGQLLRTPAMNRTHIVFSYAGDLWRVPRTGGAAERLTSAPGSEREPKFSPDGATIAFTGEYDGNVDVFTMPAAGGDPRRLTHHPDGDYAAGWTPDGKNILFASTRAVENDGGRLYTVPAAGGFPQQIPLPLAHGGSYSPDGTQLAYEPVFHWQPAWKRYRGGQTTPIWIASLADSKVLPIPRDNSNDSTPMWVGNTIYFLSDRNGPVTLFAYDTASKKVTQVIENKGLDLKSASAGPGGIVYEQFGSIHIYSFATHKENAVPIQVTGDFPEIRPHFLKVEARKLTNGVISPNGARAVFEGHGEILTVPAEKGAFRNITRSPAVEDRTPSWSPDGKWIAWFSDAPGEYQLFLRDQNGLGEIKKIDFGENHSYYYSPVWSPNSEKLAVTDKFLNLWYIDIAKGTKFKVDTNNFDGSQTDMNPRWSPDSKWIVYTKTLPTFYQAIYFYSVESAKSTQITDGLSNAQYPVFDRSGKYIYFVASTNLGMAAGGGGGNLSSLQRPVTSNAYLMVLKKDTLSPLAFENDEEKLKKEEPKKEEPKKDEAKKDEVKKDEVPKVEIDFDRISQRILALPIPARNYGALWAGKENILYLWALPEVNLSPEPPTGSLDKFDLSKRKLDHFADGIQAADLSASGEKMLFSQSGKWFITGAESAPKPGDGELKLDGLQIWVEPRAEWKQMFHEAWRIERDFLYDPNYHGLNLNQTEEKYAAFVNSLDSREDLNYLFEEMLGELTLGHVFVGGGETPDVKRTKTGLLGADYTIENGRYRFSRIFDGENWNPQLRAPLTQPGAEIKAGEYLISVNGADVPGADEIYSYFGETAGTPVVLKVGPNPDGAGSREVTVVPVENEKNLRHLAWIEDNRRKVDAATGGKVAYVHVPDTAFGGFTSFNRYYFAQTDKAAAIIDERFNHGGLLADYIVENMNRKMLSRAMSREGREIAMPAATIYGPKVMITNQYAGSGGDALPWYFRKLGIGPLVGKRTWGGLVGIGGYPELMDGGAVTAPRFAIFGLEGDWEVENRGIAPDIEVELDPAQWRLGHDTQLEKSIEVALDLLKKNPPKEYKHPAYPNYHPSAK
jgi:tricorn protease